MFLLFFSGRLFCLYTANNNVNKMEEEEHTDRKQLLAMLHRKLNSIKIKLDEDDTENQIISSNSPDSCFSYLIDLEKKGDVQADHKHLTRLIDLYNRVFSNMLLLNHGQNESYARMLVRFAELKAIQDVSEAEANFNIAKSHCSNLAFVHIAHAQFEHSKGNTKRAIQILKEAIKVGAKPEEQLEDVLQKMQTEINSFCSEDKENLLLLSNNNVQDSVKKSSKYQNVSRMSDGTGDLQLSSIFSAGMESLSGFSDEQLPGWRSGSHRKRAVVIPVRVPALPFSIPEDDDDENVDVCKQSNGTIPNSLTRQTSGSNVESLYGLSSSKKKVEEKSVIGFTPPVLTPEQSQRDELPHADSTSTLLQAETTRDPSLTGDLTFSFDQIISSNSPESCWAYLINLEKRGDPHNNTSLLNKLKNCYSTVFARMQMRQFSRNASYAKMLVRYAELRGIEDPEDARDQFVVARSNCKEFAFVHIAHAQFELSQGNFLKATSILHKAQGVNAKPAELLETALSNLKSGEKQLMPTLEEKTTSPGVGGIVPPTGENQKTWLPMRIPVNRSLMEQPKTTKEISSEKKIPCLLGRQFLPEDKRTTPPDVKSAALRAESFQTPSVHVPSRPKPHPVFQTPNEHRNPYVNSFVTPVAKGIPEVSSSAVAAHRTVQQPFTPLNHSFQTPQSLNALSNESITIKGKQFFILKLIGRGGSSKVYQVLDNKKQLFAVKYVNLEEADAQTVESYKNEIEHLNHLQQYSDQIIKLYDYEITNSYIYMLMECGNLDLNTWLRNRKTVNPLERKFYWKNMLEAVQTIHKHGIVHSDLKPANFVIVNASIKLIDFGIANKIQPDVTSIMKDSQVGTLNYMPPEAIKDTSSQSAKGRSKISPKGDVWSLGCILYCMTYGKTPFQSITNQFAKIHAIIDASHKIEFPEISEKDLMDVLKRCLVRNPRERISIAELLEHPYLQLKPPASPEPDRPSNNDLKRILTDLAALQSPNSIVRAANNLAKMCNSGRKLDVAECAKSSS